MKVGFFASELAMSAMVPCPMICFGAMLIVLFELLPVHLLFPTLTCWKCDVCCVLGQLEEQMLIPEQT
jgi:hypothetical protein